MNAPILLAARDPAIVIVIVLFVVIPLIGVVTSKIRDAMQTPLRPPTGQPGGARIQEQIDEFLRRASQRRTGPTEAAEEPIEAEVIDDDEPVGDRVGRQTQKYLDNSEFRRHSDQLGDDVAAGDRQFSQHVTEAFRGEVGRLKERRGESSVSPQVESGDKPESEDISRPMLEALPIAGSGLADFLGDSDAIVKAIIMSEILHRPDWSKQDVSHV